MAQENARRLALLEKVAKAADARTWPESGGCACDECSYEYGSRGERYNFSRRCKLCRALTALARVG